MSGYSNPPGANGGGGGTPGFTDDSTLGGSGTALDKYHVKTKGITSAQIADANNDGIAASPSIRTLGTGAQQASAGNHTHAGTALTANNLSDLTDIPTARSNLGLGSAATHATTDYDSSGAAAAAITTSEAYTDTALTNYLKKDGTIALTGNLSAGTHKITTLVNPTAGSQEAATANYTDAGDASTLTSAHTYADTGDSSTLTTAEAYTDTALTNYLKKDGTIALTGNQSFGTHKATNLANPTAGSQEAATANYVDAGDATTLATAEAYADSIAAGASPKPSARFAPTVALPTYVISGGGSTMTGFAIGALGSYDGITPALNDIFFYDQDAQHGGIDNGLWKITLLGSISVAFIAVRISQMAVGAHANGALTRVSEGTTRQGQEPLCISDETSDTIGTNILTWVDTSIFSERSSASPVTVGTTTASGSSLKVSRDDHSHSVNTTIVATTTNTLSMSGKTLTSPTLSGTVAGSVTFSGALTLSGACTFSGNNTFSGGTIGTSRRTSSATDKPTASDTEVDLHAQCTVTLDNTLANDTVFVFWDTTGAAATSAHTLTPDGGLLINGAATYSFNRSYGSITVKKLSGAWYTG